MRKITGPFLFFAAFFLIFASLDLPRETEAGPAQAPAPSLILHVDQKERARGFCEGFKVLVSIGGSFEFFERSLTGSRERIFSGPWRGNYLAHSARSYLLTGSDVVSGAEYRVSITQQDERTIDLHLSFRTPSRTSGLEFEVVKLESDIFKGGELAAEPSAKSDAKGIPTEPRTLADRMLLSDKRGILVKGPLCDIEIIDVSGGSFLYAVDGRNVPWDRHRSIGIGAKVSGLAPSSRQEYRYRIRSLPPSRSISEGVPPAMPGRAGIADPFSFFKIPPKVESKMPGAYGLDEGDAIFGKTSGTAEIILSSGLRRITGLQLSVRASDNATVTSRGIHIERVSRKNRPEIPPEGFEITVTKDRVTVLALDERGCLYGVYALFDRIGHKGGVWEIACGQLRDWPDLPLRGACLELLAPALRDVSIMKRYLNALSRARCNTVIFLHHPKHMRSWLRGVDDGRWTKEQMAEIADYTRWLHMEVWGGMGSGFEKRDFPEMEIHEGTNLYNPKHEGSYRYLFSLYKQILDVYRPSTLLIGHDEIQGLEVYAEKSGKSTADILAEDVRRIYEWLASQNVSTAMWGDMLLDHQFWESKVGSANSRNPFFRSGATHLALKKLPRSVFILDWHYDLKKEYASIGYFRDNGFNVAGAAWHDPHAAKSLAQSVKGFGGQGIIATDFGFWRTLSPAATTLYAPLCGWSVHCRIEDDRSDAAALAEMVRPPAYAKEIINQVPVDLRASANRSTRASSNGTGKGPFDAGPFLDLRGFQTGRQVLEGIVFDVAPDDGGRLANTVVVSNASRTAGGMPNATTVFMGDIQADRIAFLHTAFIMEPIRDVRRIGQYRIEYTDGSFEAIDLLENWNITDVRSSEGLRRNAWTFLRLPDLLIGAKRAWQGPSETGMPLNLQIFLWENPHPGKSIRSIRLLAGAEPKGTRIALLGLTFIP